VGVGDVVIKAVVFDVGEVLVDETRENCAWADWLGVPRHTFSAVYGCTDRRGTRLDGDIPDLPPGFDISRERELRARSGIPEAPDDNDLYPDRRCRPFGRPVWVGLAGNQTMRAGSLLRSICPPT
jgi:hypothetical protein